LKANVHRADLISELTDMRLKTRRNVRNPARLRGLIRGDLEQLTDAELEAEFHAVHEPPADPGKSYGVGRLDRAISDAVYMLARTANGSSSFTVHDIEVVLSEEYGAEIAGRACALAIDGAYELRMPRWARP
jgi:hypothetical protein